LNQSGPKVAAIVPAHNEAATIAAVVEIALRSPHVDEVLVVDNLSTDETASLAKAAGARVIPATTLGKGNAMAEGVAATDAELIVFLDADLLSLQPGHIDRLVRAVHQGAGMSCGLFDRGPLLNPIFLRFLPVLTGQRALHRELFESLQPEQIQGYRIEAALNSRCADLGLKRVSFVCPGLWHLTKEKKSGSPVIGFVRKVSMLATAMASYATYFLRHRLLTRQSQSPSRSQ